jgi:hypothetical protein
VNFSQCSESGDFTIDDKPHSQKQEEKMSFKYTNFVVVWSFIILVIVVGYTFADAAPARYVYPTELRWITISALMVLFIAFLGYQVNNRLAGILIDSRNKISLSRFQMTAWTILVMSAFLTIGMGRSRGGYLSELSDEMAAQCRAEIEDTQLDTPEGQAAAAAIADEECVEQPLKITFPPEVVAALGISSASLAGSALVKGTKKEKEKSVELIEERQAKLDKAWDDARDKLAEVEIALVEKRAQYDIANAICEEAYDYWQDAISEETKQDAWRTYEAARAEQGGHKNELDQLQVRKAKLEAVVQKAERDLAEFVQAAENAKGLLHSNESPSDASWADMFREEEITNYRSISLSKLQMFFFTIALIFTYAASLYTLMGNDPMLKNPLGVDLPAFTASLNVLLGISHAGYLVVKNTDNA